MKALVFGYLGYITLGWILLCLPFSQKAEGVSSLDHLFSATSAVSTTGLATVGTLGTYTFFGQLVILAMIQLGGIGYMTLGSCILLARHQELPVQRKKVAELSFVLPDGFQIRQFLRNVVLFTATGECLGADPLFFAFLMLLLMILGASPFETGGGLARSPLGWLCFPEKLRKLQMTTWPFDRDGIDAKADFIGDVSERSRQRSQHAPP